MDIKLNSIFKSFDKEIVLNDLSYTFKSGVNYVISGNNGAGKTTLFRILVAMLVQDSGEVEIADPTKVGWVSSSELGLMGRLTGSENIEVISKLLPNSYSKLTNEKVERWSELKTFQRALSTPFFKCSSGMKQVLKIFCATLHGPTILIMDEPFRNLDSNTRKAIAAILSENKEIKSIIYSDHFTIEKNIKNTHSLCLKAGKLVDLN